MMMMMMLGSVRVRVRVRAREYARARVCVWGGGRCSTMVYASRYSKGMTTRVIPFHTRPKTIKDIVVLRFLVTHCPFYSTTTLLYYLDITKVLRSTGSLWNQVHINIK